MSHKALFLAACLGVAYLANVVLAKSVSKAPADAPASAWKTMFSDGLLDAEGKAVSLDQLKGKLVGIYFSAHWCPPCRVFTPKLVEFRDKNAADLEIVFVSVDRTQEEKDTYMKEANMKWATVPYRSKSGDALLKKHEIRGIPTLIMLSPAGNVVSKNARAEVTTNPDKCVETWKKTAAEVDAAK